MLEELGIEDPKAKIFFPELLVVAISLLLVRTDGLRGIKPYTTWPLLLEVQLRELSSIHNMPTGAGGLIQSITEIDPMAVRARRIENYLRSELIIYTAILDGIMVSCTEKIEFILGNRKIII
jgi:hypothetical protein